MNQSAKAVLSLVGGLTACVAIFAHYLHEPPRQPYPWIWVLGFSLLALLCAAILICHYSRRVRVPSFFEMIGITPFERDGVSFGVVTAATPTGHVLLVPYQSRHGCHGKATLSFLATPEALVPVSTVFSAKTKIDLAPFEAGLLTIPVDIDPSLSGKRVQIWVAIRPRWPWRMGREAILPAGVSAGPALPSPSFQLVRGLLTIATFGTAPYSTPAQINAVVPAPSENAVAKPATDRTIERTVLWQLDQDTESLTSSAHEIRAWLQATADRAG